MRIIGLRAENIRAIEKLELDEKFFENNKYLIVGKNGSGKTTLLEIVRLGLTINNDVFVDNPQYFTYLRDPAKESIIELTIKLDEEEVEICKQYLDAVNNGGSPQWNQDESKNYDLDKVDSVVINRIKLRANQPAPLNAISRTAIFDSSQSWISNRTDKLVDANGTSSRKWHILKRFLAQNTNNNKAFVYIHPYRSVQISEPQIFQNFGIVQQALGGGNQQVNDPINGINMQSPDYSRTFYTFNYNHELYNGVIGEFYKLAQDETNKKKLEMAVIKDMIHVNEMIAPKAIRSINIDAQTNMMYYEVTDGEVKHPLTSLSSGEDQLLIFGLTLPKYLNMSKDYIKSIVLIDEPEVHLHPDFARRLGEFLNSGLNTTGKQQLFISSHSVEIVRALSDDAYQITSDGLNKLGDVKDRAKLFNDMGSSFSIADLVTRVVFVEGDEQATKLQDHDFYQKVTNDPYAKNVRFIGSGGKTSVFKMKAGSDEWQQFVSAQVGRLGGQNLLAIFDGDVLKWSEGIDSTTDTIYFLPCYSFESILYQPSVIGCAYSHKTSEADVRIFLESKKEELIVSTRDEKLIGELDRSATSIFNFGGRESKAVKVEEFEAKFDAFTKKKTDIADAYYKKAMAAKDWYLHVDNHKLRSSILAFLKEPGPAVDQKLFEAVTFDHLPLEMQRWFKDKNLKS